jgi:hypothetical protein
VTIYPASMENADGTVRIAGEIEFPNAASQPAANAPPILSGTLPNTGAWVSATAKVNPVSRPITVAVEFVTAGTNTIATCTIAISPDNVTYTTLCTPGASAAINNTGAFTLGVLVPLPQGWYIKLTFANGTVAQSIYY